MGNIDILEKLEEYSKAGYVPMHMPGGKRNTEYASTSELDITEIDGFDNMHNADGIIKNASDRAAKLYGADKTLMLVNGSTAGILSAICGATKRKGKIIVARNCHVSVYNALIMAQLEPVYVIPEVDNDTGIYRGLSLEQIRKCVENNRDAKCNDVSATIWYFRQSRCEDLWKIWFPCLYGIEGESISAGRRYPGNRFPDCR